MHIFVATHNGGQYLKDCIDSLHNLESTTKVVIIDNNSDDPETLEILKNAENLIISVDKNVDNCYDTGAYIYAINKYIDDDYYFLFCHDDVIFKDGFEAKLKEELQHCDVLALTTFTGIWDSEYQKEICMKLAGTDKFEERTCIFGPIFCTTRDVLKKVVAQNLLWFKPKNKEEQKAMERGWGYIFYRVDAKIKPLIEWPGQALMEGNHDAVIMHRLQRKQ